MIPLAARHCVAVSADACIYGVVRYAGGHIVIGPCSGQYPDNEVSGRAQFLLVRRELSLGASRLRVRSSSRGSLSASAGQPDLTAVCMNLLSGFGGVAQPRTMALYKAGCSSVFGNHLIVCLSLCSRCASRCLPARG